MITLQMFLLGLLAVSTLTGLATEAVKSILNESGKSYYANTLAGIVALVLSVAVSIGYVMVTDIGFATPTIVYIIALVFMSWLCAMVGYDKVIQTIAQFKDTQEG